MRYIPCSLSDRKAMLAAMGLKTIDELFAGIPENLRLGRPLDIPNALSEPELLEYFRRAAAENAAGCVSFLGAGVYQHFIPVAVDAIISRSEFFTAYTPYQAEISQGTLQAIFEFQTYITQLTGQEVTNASMYDGSTAVTEAVLMARRITKRQAVRIQVVRGSPRIRWRMSVSREIHAPGVRRCDRSSAACRWMMLPGLTPGSVIARRRASRSRWPAPVFGVMDLGRSRGRHGRRNGLEPKTPDARRDESPR